MIISCNTITIIIIVIIVIISMIIVTTIIVIIVIVIINATLATPIMLAMNMLTTIILRSNNE